MSVLSLSCEFNFGKCRLLTKTPLTMLDTWEFVSWNNFLLIGMTLKSILICRNSNLLRILFNLKSSSVNRRISLLINKLICLVFVFYNHHMLTFSQHTLHKAHFFIFMSDSIFLIILLLFHNYSKNWCYQLIICCFIAAIWISNWIASLWQLRINSTIFQKILYKRSHLFGLNNFNQI